MTRWENGSDLPEKGNAMEDRNYEAPEVEDAGADEAPAVTAAGATVTDRVE